MSSIVYAPDGKNVGTFSYRRLDMFNLIVADNFEEWKSLEERAVAIIRLLFFLCFGQTSFMRYALKTLHSTLL